MTTLSVSCADAHLEERDDCRAEMFCVREADGGARCENGYRWVDPEDKDDLRCVLDEEEPSEPSEPSSSTTPRLGV